MLIYLLAFFFFLDSVHAVSIYNNTTTSTTSVIDAGGAGDGPIVVLHGVASSVANMILLAEWLSLSFNRPVFNIEIGNGFRNSFFMPLNTQLNLLCDTIYNNSALLNGFDFIGLSQGGLLARGYLNKCNKFPVRNLITIVSPHGGVIEDMSIDMYTDFSQKHYSISGYWRNPAQLEKYLIKCSYLPFINNEIVHPLSLQYKNRILSLKNFIIIWSPNDDTIYPVESAKFSFFDRDFNVIPLRDTLIYIDDTLGLKKLNNDNRLHIHKTNCTHTQHRDPICFPQLYDILKNYLFT
jgi:palmitoyl-protein thioesterase